MSAWLVPSHADIPDAVAAGISGHEEAEAPGVTGAGGVKERYVRAHAACPPAPAAVTARGVRWPDSVCDSHWSLWFRWHQTSHPRTAANRDDGP
jgi:hypothetical protein